VIVERPALERRVVASLDAGRIPVLLGGCGSGRTSLLLRLEGVDTQYMWMTGRKQVAGWCDWLEHTEWTSIAHLRNIDNAYSRDPATPASGRFASAALMIAGILR